MNPAILYTLIGAVVFATILFGSYYLFLLKGVWRLKSIVELLYSPHIVCPRAFAHFTLRQWRAHGIDWHTTPSFVDDWLILKGLPLPPDQPTARVPHSFKHLSIRQWESVRNSWYANLQTNVRDIDGWLKSENMPPRPQREQGRPNWGAARAIRPLKA